MLALQLLSYGVLLGAVYALLSSGLVLVFSIVEIPNFAHAGIFMVGGYTGYVIFQTAHLPAVVSMFGAFIVSGAIGALLWYAVMRPLLKRPRADMFVTTVGALAVLQSLCAMVFGPSSKGYEVVPGGGQIVLGFFVVERLWIVGVALVIGVILIWVIEGTMIGRAMRGVAQNPMAADALGMNSARIAVVAVVLGSGLGGVAGALLCGITGVQPNSGADVLLRVFAIVILGGMGSLRGAVIASLVMGLVESFVSYFASDYTDLCFFAVMFIVLLVRPNGLFSTGHVSRLETV